METKTIKSVSFAWREIIEIFAKILLQKQQLVIAPPSHPGIIPTEFPGNVNISYSPHDGSWNMEVIIEKSYNHTRKDNEPVICEKNTHTSKVSFPLKYVQKLMAAAALEKAKQDNGTQEWELEEGGVSFLHTSFLHHIATSPGGSYSAKTIACTVELHLKQEAYHL